MAAVICRAIIKPFEWCAKGCSAACDALSKCCDECSKCCGETFGPCCAEFAKCCNLQEFFSKPFSIMVAAAFFLTLLPSIVLFGFVGGNANTECVKAPNAGINLDVWCIVQGVSFILHFSMAYYVFKKFQVPQYPGESFYKRLCHLVCEDVVMAFYICFLIFSLVWAILGTAIDTEADRPPGCSQNDLNVMADVILVLTWTFFGVGMFAFIYAAIEGSINEGCCTRECGGEDSPCVLAGRCCCGDCCCPTQAEINARQAKQAMRDIEQGVPAVNPVQQDMNRQPNGVAYVPPARPAPVPVVYAQPVQATPVAYEGVPQQQQRQQERNGEPKTAGDQAVDAAMAVGGAAARLAGKGLRMGAKALFGSGNSKPKNQKK